MLATNSSTELQPTGMPGQNPDCREALLFIPGLSTEDTKHTVEEISHHLAGAMDRGARSGRAKFRVGEVREESMGSTGMVRVTTIFRDDAGKETALVDVYKLEYFHLFQQKLLDEPALKKILRIPGAILPTAFKLFRYYGNTSLSSREKLQFVIVFLGLILILLYAFLLVGAVVQTVQGVLDVGQSAAGQAVPAEAAPMPSGSAEQEGSAAPSSPWEDVGATLQSAFSPAWELLQKIWDSVWTWLKTAWDRAWAWSQEVGATAVIVLAGLGILLPKSDRIREMITNTATMIIAMINYLQYGESRGILNGQILALLEHVAEKKDYPRVTILAFSFGSLLALDTLFPREPGTPERVKTVRSLVTIGCPFDFIHMIWPRYYESRTPVEALEWFNIYSPTDVFSSNFLSISKTESAHKPQADPRPEDQQLSRLDWLKHTPPTNVKYSIRGLDDELSIWDVFHFVGLSNHAKYWDAAKEPQRNAFDLVVPRMFKDNGVVLK